MNFQRFLYFSAALVFFSLNISATQDPFEDLNRKIWAFNESLDDNFAKPTAEIYTNITPVNIVVFILIPVIGLYINS